MSLFKIALKAGASVALLAAMASPALAVRVQGGGSSLLAPYFAQVYCVHTGGFNPPLATPPANCHIPAADGDHGRLFSSTTQVDIQDPSVTDTSLDTVNFFDYLISNSGGGQKAILTATSSQLGTFPAAGTYTAVPYATANTLLGFSDAPLSSDALLAYGGSTAHNNDNGGTVGDLGISLKAVNGSGTGFTHPRSIGFGKLIQFPVTIDPVAIGYNPSGLGLGANVLKLDKDTYCKIFNGIITHWNDSAITTLNPSITSTAAIRLVGRTNGSGTTSIFTHHLAAVCAGVLGNQFTVANLSAGAFKNIPSSLTSIYSLDADSPTEVADINGTAASIGYVGADYATPSTAVATTVTSALLNDGSGNYNDPSSANAITAFGSIAPPSGTDRQDPAKWVPDTSNPSSGYNIIGTTNIVTYTTTGSAAKATALVSDGTTPGVPEGLLHWYFNNSNSAPTAIMSQANLGVLPPAWNTAITESFVTGSDGQGNGIH